MDVKEEHTKESESTVQRLPRVAQRVRKALRWQRDSQAVDNQTGPCMCVIWSQKEGKRGNRELKEGRKDQDGSSPALGAQAKRTVNLKSSCLKETEQTEFILEKIILPK